MVKRAMFTVRLPEDLYNDLKDIADKEQRSLNNMIERLLTKSVKDYKKEHDIS